MITLSQKTTAFLSVLTFLLLLFIPAQCTAPLTLGQPADEWDHPREAPVAMQQVIPGQVCVSLAKG